MLCVRNGKGPERLDYFRHLVSKVEVDAFDYPAVNWDLSTELAEATERFYRITLGQENVERIFEEVTDSLETDEQVLGWLAANLPFDYFSLKQLRQVVRQVVERLYQANDQLRGRLALVKFEVRQRIDGFIARETDKQTEAAFQRLFDSKKLCFFLDCLECRFEIPEPIDVRAMRPLCHENGDGVKRSLFDFTPDDLNEYEKSVALFLDDHPQVLWWYRNLVGAENFSIQGYRRSPIYPDFVVQEGRNSKPVARVLVLESKGKHLKGNEDTKYKRSVADYFDKTGRKVPWQKLAKDFADHRFRFQVLDEGDYADRDWKDELKKKLEAANSD